MYSTDVLSQLEALGPTVDVPPAPVAALPRTPLEALARWLAAVGVRAGGMTLAPRSRPLVPVFEAWARAQGWDVTPTPAEVGRAFALAGCPRSPGGGYRVSREAAAALWRAVGGKPPSRPRKTPPLPKPRADRRVTRHPTKPIRTCDGRYWTQRGLAETLGVSTLAVSRAVHQGVPVRGLHARFATPAEVRLWRAQEDEWDGAIPSPS